MGSWNHTCAVTNLPIYAGEDVVVVLLKSATTKYKSSFCYPGAYHTPLPLTFQGKYDDYGAVEDCHGPALNVIVDNIRNALVEFDLGENEYHDIEVKKKDFNVDMIFEADHEDRLQVVQMDGSMLGDIRTLQHTVIRQEVFDGIVNGMHFEHWDRELEETIEIGYNDLKAMYPKCIADLRGMFDDDNEVTRIIRMLDPQVGDTFVGRLLSSRQPEGMGSSYPIDIPETLFDMVEDGADDEALISLIDNAIQFQMYHHYMFDARMSYAVPSGVGSQNMETTAQELRATLTLSAAAALKKRWEE